MPPSLTCRLSPTVLSQEKEGTKLFKQKCRHNGSRLPPLALLILIIAAPTAVSQSHTPSSASSQQLSTLHLPESWVAESDQQGSEFGLAAASAGDVNGDGYDDVIVGAPRYDAGTYREGAAFVFYGSAGGISSLPDWHVGGGQTGARFGSAVASAGDINHDGFDDVLIGAHAYNDGQAKVGAVFVFLGAAGGLSVTADTLLIGEEKEAEFGFSVASAGDVNGDEYDDVIVGARYADTGKTNGGAAYLYYGSESGLALLPGWTVLGGQEDAQLGTAVASAGDVDDDGCDDIVVGAPYYDDVAANEGAAFVFRGSPTGLGDVPHWQAQGGQAEAGFGSAVAGAGDVNGDGFGELIVGAPRYSDAWSNEGAAFLFSGTAVGLSPTPSRRLTGGQAAASFGTSVGSAGDVNGDGFGDVVVGSPLYSGDQSQEGAVFLYSGSANGLSHWFAWSAEGDKAETWFGYTVGTAGNVNGDAFSDLIAGAPQYRLNHIIVGRVMGYYGTSGPTVTSTFLPLVVSANP
ncbi:MAG: FG-GAP repeat protein [Ardenticatenaceae bacterium]|nr:FG-GAP repeat protein [Ardenticatenaceae bacterium]